MLHDVDHRRVIAYGAGKMALKYLPKFLQYTTVDEIWDKSSELKDLFAIKVKRPDFGRVPSNSIFIIFIEDRTARYEVANFLEEEGFGHIYGYDLVLEMLCNGAGIDEIINGYCLVGQEAPEVLYYLVPDDADEGMPGELGEKLFAPDKHNNFEMLLSDTLVIRDSSHLSQCMKKYEGEICGFSEFAIRFERFLRDVFREHIKTKYRPIRMIEDDPYDQFAVYEVMKACFAAWGVSDDEACRLLEFMYGFSKAKALISLYCDYLVKAHRERTAYEIALKERHRYPNSLIISESFVNVVRSCNIEMGDQLYSNLPFEEYFCWSGMNFAICEGTEGDNAEMAPCFRTLQCVARPGGMFWTSAEWSEYRKSILDGSFRYCQKDRCPNLLGGWLPRKSDINETWLDDLISDNKENIPPLEELHFSYDDHCNLHCASCRLETRANTKERAEKLDGIYDQHLKKLLEKAKHLTISGCGEAVISKHSQNVLGSLSADVYKDLVVELRTNVVSLTKKSWENIGDGRKAIRHITASVDGATKGTFESLREPAKWNQFLEGLSFIQGLRKNGEIDFYEFHVVVHDVNIQELYDILKLADSYGADAVTYSRMVNWRGMPVDEYARRDPFWSDHPRHKELLGELEKIVAYRDRQSEHRMFINVHGYPDPDESYKEIRLGRLKVR